MKTIFSKEIISIWKTPESVFPVLIFVFAFFRLILSFDLHFFIILLFCFVFFLQCHSGYDILDSAVYGSQMTDAQVLSDYEGQTLNSTSKSPLGNIHK